MITSILDKIRKVFQKEAVLKEEEIQRLSHLPQDQARKELARMLSDDCVKRAKEFVNGELRRPDSPYQGVSASSFFHEMLSVTFWLLQNKIKDHDQLLVGELHDIYFRSFGSSSLGQACSVELNKKYSRYDDTWNEITGHFDEFGLCVVQHIFGTEESTRTRERTFWIIQYADSIDKIYSRMPGFLKSIALHQRHK